MQLFCLLSFCSGNGEISFLYVYEKILRESSLDGLERDSYGMTRKLHFCKSLHFLSIPLDYIEPHRKWTNKKSSPFMRKSSWFFMGIIKHLIKNHLFLSFRMNRNSENFIGMIGSSSGFLVAPAGMRSWDLHIPISF